MGRDPVDALRNRPPRLVITRDGRRLRVSIVRDRCVGAMSCVYLAPQVFDCAVDLFAVRMRPIRARAVRSDDIVLAAQGCPTKAIVVEDQETGEVIVG